jgi:hypothetical protein
MRGGRSGLEIGPRQLRQQGAHLVEIGGRFGHRRGTPLARDPASMMTRAKRKNPGGLVEPLRLSSRQ